MSIKNNILLTPEEKEIVNKAIATLHRVLDPKLTTMTTEEIMSAQKLGDKSVSFVLKCCEYIEKYPNIGPSYITSEEIRNDLTSMDELKLLNEGVSPILEEIKDSRIAFGMKAIHKCNSYYKAIQIAANDNIGPAKIIYDDLKTRYKSNKTSKK